MGGLEALEATESPDGCSIASFVLVGALYNFGSGLGLVTVLSELLNQMLNVESFLVIEQAHLVDDALDVRASLLIVGEVPLLVLGYLSLGDAKLSYALFTVLDEVLLSLDLPGGCFFSKDL